MNEAASKLNDAFRARPERFRMLQKGIQTAGWNGKELKLLEVGCSCGDASAYMHKEEGFSVTAIDLDEEMVRQAQKTHSGPVFLWADARKMPFPSESFDGIYTEAAFSPISDKKEVLLEYSRVLKPGGRYLINDFGIRAAVDADGRKRVAYIPCFAGVGTIEDYRKLFEESGFDVVYIREDYSELIRIAAWLGKVYGVGASEIGHVLNGYYRSGASESEVCRLDPSQPAADDDFFKRASLTYYQIVLEKKADRKEESNIIRHTKSLCPVCMKTVDAQYERRNGKVYLTKRCEEHGSYSVLAWSDDRQFERWDDRAVHAASFGFQKENTAECPRDCGLCKKHEGGICTAVLEVTYRCNMNCNICFADTKKVKYDPDLEQIRNMYMTAIRYGGDCSIQISGGEPTVREDLPEILKMGKSLGMSHIQVNTNGIRLAEEEGYAELLKNSGADLIYLQFDGIKEEIFKKIRGRKLWDIKQRAIRNCEKAGLGIILVPVIMRGVNDDSIGEMIGYAKAHIPTVKGIHFQPVSYFGRYPGQAPADADRMNLSDVIRIIEEQTNGEVKESMLAPRKRFDPHCSFSGLFYMDEKGRLHSMNNPESRNADCCSTDFARQTNAFTNKHWRMKDHTGESPVEMQQSTAAFVRRMQDYTLTISGMGFQDIWNIDVGRLKGCCVLEITSDGRAVPLCAFHVTDVKGRRLYNNE